jgi:hypothetical protein
MDTLKIAGDPKFYDVVHTFGDNRAIINYDGLFVLVDRVAGTDQFELSGEPARGENEKPVLDALVATIKDSVTVTKSDDE